jgi:hypothetical protein
MEQKCAKKLWPSAYYFCVRREHRLDLILLRGCEGFTQETIYGPSFKYNTPSYTSIYNYFSRENVFLTLQIPPWLKGHSHKKIIMKGIITLGLE